MNVLSLFDGMSCGQIALHKAGIKYTTYFASEIDKYAIRITNKNYPQTKHIGCVTKVKGEDLPQIDLLIGGSPCQGFSIAGKLLNFDDPRSKLFFEWYRLWKELKPKWFLLENVVMGKDIEEQITQLLGVEPHRICSSRFSGQMRRRLYWTNIPLLTFLDKVITAKDVIPKLKGYIPNQYSYDARRVWRTDRVPCLTKSDLFNNFCIITKDEVRPITCEEAEKLQTVPVNYTKGVSDTQRKSMLGNGWTVDVIAHIFKGLETLVVGE